MIKTPGFCRHIEKEWLEQTLRWVASEADSVQLNKNLEVFLGTYIATKENRRKARNLLTSIWMRPKNKDVFLRLAFNYIKRLMHFHYLFTGEC
ncbi:hypothetical protein QVN07_01630 [Escherichia coli]|uniref:hypothetical protein n=1 Tax=Escherichia coli TaxID=562 RepID=UPI0025B164F4|nr:hypothetical protein [Escherichia coli]WJV76220.1 hypothetical protein QVN07_01630 [Escherichia coli]